jgi:hypothetical protein
MRSGAALALVTIAVWFLSMRGVVMDTSTATALTVLLTLIGLGIKALFEHFCHFTRYVLRLLLIRQKMKQRDLKKNG